MGNLYVVATPIGNLKDISQRAIETLKEVDYILCEDTRTSLVLLNHFNIKNKLVSYHKFNEQDRSNSIINDLKAQLIPSLLERNDILKKHEKMREDLKNNIVKKYNS